MRHTRHVAYSLLGVVLSGTAGAAACASHPPWAASARDYPAIVEPGGVSTALPEFALTLSPDGRRLYFNRASADRSTLTVMVSTRDQGRWSQPVVASFSGQYRDVDPFVTPDGTRLYFSSDRPRSGSSVRSFNTWYVERRGPDWSEPIDPGEPLNSDSSDTFVSVDRNGLLVFSSTRDGAQRLYATSMVAGAWTTPRPLDLGTPGNVGNPLLSPSGRFILIVVEVPDRGGDLFVSCRRGDQWGAPQTLGPLVNSRYLDFAPALDPAETTLFFTSERPGVVGPQPDSVRPPGDLYWIPLNLAGVRCP